MYLQKYDLFVIIPLSALLSSFLEVAVLWVDVAVVTVVFSDIVCIYLVLRRIC